jgi:hypothetical protein
MGTWPLKGSIELPWKARYAGSTFHYLAISHFFEKITAPPAHRKRPRRAWPSDTMSHNGMAGPGEPGLSRPPYCPPKASNLEHAVLHGACGTQYCGGRQRMPRWTGPSTIRAIASPLRPAANPGAQVRKSPGSTTSIISPSPPVG